MPSIDLGDFAGIISFNSPGNFMKQVLLSMINHEDKGIFPLCLSPAIASGKE